jgi:predicted transcriptional regulator
MSQKELALEALARLPDDCSLEDMAEKLRFLAGVQAGIDQLDRGLEVDHDEVKKKLASWVSR